MNIFIDKEVILNSELHCLKQEIIDKNFLAYIL